MWKSASGPGTLTYCQFQSLLEEMDSSYKDIPLHCAVRWLICRKYLADRTGHLNEHNLKLQESGQNVSDIRDKWEALVQKLAVFFQAMLKHSATSNAPRSCPRSWYHPLYDPGMKLESKVRPRLWLSVDGGMGQVSMSVSRFPSFGEGLLGATTDLTKHKRQNV